MKISYNWLKEYVDIKITPEKLAELLTMHSFEVENIIYQGKGLENVVVGEVLEKKKHPDADKLSIVKVKISETEIFEIVCGALNIEAGQKVAVALVGAQLPCGLKIEKRKVRGVESCGMVCAEDELGLGKNHEGIMVLDKSLKVGTTLEKALGLDDAIFEIDILPNRAHDCLSHIGVAREAAVVTKMEIKKDKFILDKSKILNISEEVPANNFSNDVISIEIKNEKLCRRYSAAVVEDIEIKDSPDWLKNRLKSCGIRPINNIVDITNYVMLEFGQPMHAFDAGKIGAKIVIRNAGKEEKIKALDGNEYELGEKDLIVSDENRPIAIAGIIGGEETAIDKSTKSIIFESANFCGQSIRKTSKRLKLSSESSYRFEREIDPETVFPAILQAAKLAKELAGGSVRENIIDVYSFPRKPKKIKLPLNRIKNLLGVEIEKIKVKEILESLSFEIEEWGGNIIVQVPTFRIDIEKANDIIEEIGRIYGYENIPAIPPKVYVKPTPQDNNLILDREFRKILEGLEWNEIYNYSFVSEKDVINTGLEIKNHFELENPLNEDLQFMRTNLLSGLLRKTEQNLKYKDDFKLFELGAIYLKSIGILPSEGKILAGVAVSKKNENISFYEIKGQTEVLFRKLGIEKMSYRRIENPEPFWHKGRSADVFCEGRLIGRIGEIHPSVLSAFSIKSRVLYFEIYKKEITKFYRNEKSYKKINRFPQIELDLSVVFNKDIEWADVEEVVFNLKNEFIKKIEPFDVYQGKRLGKNKKSVAFRIFYQTDDRTLKEKEVDKIQSRIIRELEKIGGMVRKR